MKIEKINSIQICNQQKKSHENNKNSKGIAHQNPNFKGGMGILGLADGLMSFIDSQGYIVSFLIQDGLGMTIPRVGTGLFRDKEETGQFNFKEATEVFLREALSGPYMMFVAPAMVFLTSFFCRSTRTNTQLIKTVGNNLKTMVKDPAFDKSLLKDGKKFKKEFYKYNVEKFYKDTVPNDKEADKTIEYILSEFDNMTNNGYGKRNAAVGRVVGKINEKIIENSANMDCIDRMNIVADGKKKTFATKDVMKAIRDYGIDAIEKNKYVSEIDEKSAENIKNNFATKRLLFNIANIVATLGGLAVIPKIYARGKVAPGAQRLLKAQEEAKKQNEQNSVSENKQAVAFKGKGINSGGIFAKIGSFLTKKIPAFIQQEFEYDGINFTKTLMASLALFGLLLPRGKKAYDRALVDENGKKDLSELNEILLRDTISSLGVVFTVPILTKCFVKMCENNTGFVLTNRASKDKNWAKRFLDVINPYSDLRVFNSSELQALYNNINSKKRMLNLCEYITLKEGDLQKILSKSKNADLVFNNNAISLESLKNLSLKQKNEKITNFFRNMEEGKANELIKKVMQDSGKVEKSVITKIARGLYSVPGAITTVAISPIILGCLVPMITYSNTRKAHAKMEQGVKNNEQIKKVA